MGELWTTDQLVDLLNRLGLEGSENKLTLDIKAGYLPRQAEGYSKKAGRRWSAQSVRRACYLYRLRKIGVKGPLLKVLLFLRDGTGWEEVKPLCMTGFNKAVRIQQSPVRDRIYKRPPTLEELDLYTSAIAEDADIKNDNLVRFCLGMGYFGQAMKGSSLSPLFSAYFDAFCSPISHASTAAISSVVEHTFTYYGTSWERMLEIVKESTPAEAENAASSFRRFLADHRRVIYLRWRENRSVCRSTNLVSLGGIASHEMSELLRSTPSRITAPQLMASLLVPIFVTNYIFSTIQDVVDTVSPEMAALIPGNGSIPRSLLRILQE